MSHDEETRVALAGIGNDVIMFPPDKKDTNIGSITNLKQWKEFWNEAMNRKIRLVEELIGLLHMGLSLPLPDEEKAELVCIYLYVADGFRENSFESLNKINEIKNETTFKTSDWYFQQITEKAWKIICTRFFKNTNEGKKEGYIPHSPSWAGVVVKQTVLEKLVWFFDYNRKNQNNLPPPSGYRKNEHDEIVRRFLVEMFSRLWANYQYLPFSIQEYLDLTKPKIAGILAAIGEMDVLMKPSYIRLMDLRVVEELERIALSHVKDPTAEQIRRAAFENGNKTAQCAYLLRQRLDKILVVSLK